MDLKRIEEFQIDQLTHEAIRELLSKSFPGYPTDQSFFKQSPDFRYLLWQAQCLVAHMAVEHRHINNSGQLLRIFGVVDLCVDEDFQHQRIASRFLLELESLGKLHDIDFIVLQAQEPQLYENHGFQMQSNLCQWLLIQNNATLGVARRRLEQSLMIKPLNNKQWETGLVDFLGHVF
ncbi:MAG: GNAT family N-acetyltransferase [Saprospiraceae bacterium]|nr:GNAT family N-acetyltransferase [Saprospiraceae bacterium]